MNPTSSAVCYLCQSGRITKLSERIRAGLEKEFALRPHRCEDCGLVFLYPLMSPEEERAFYRDAYRRIYHGAGYDLDSFHRARQTDSNGRRARLLESGLLRGKVLDVGCSTGNFLETIRGNVTSVAGVELDQNQRNYANSRGIQVTDRLHDFVGTKFDLITVFHVLEHIRDPIAFLAELRGFLAPGGALVVEVPNVDDALLSRYRIEEFAVFYWHPAHSYYFSEKTLRIVAERAGFGVEVTGIQRYTLANHLSWLRDRQPGGKTVEAGFLSPETEESYQKDLCESFACDTLWLVGHASEGNPQI